MKSTKKALFTSIMSLLLCVSMLVGTTFAWFTDSVTSGTNQIVAGSLDIEVSYQDGSTWKSIEGVGSLFDPNALWEPGHTEYVTLKVENKGNLALNYKALVTPISEKGGVNMAGESFKLSDFLMFGTTNAQSVADRDAARALVTATATGLNQADLSMSGHMEPGDDAQYITLVVYMPEEVGNAANYLTGTAVPEIKLGITVLATQMEHENDSFGNDYDADAVTIGTYNVGAFYDYYPQVSASQPVPEGSYESITVSASGKLNQSDAATTKLAEVVIPAGAVEAGAKEVSVSVKPVNPTNSGAQTVIESASSNPNVEAVNFDIHVDGIKTDNQVPIQVSVFVGKGLNNVVVYHNGTVISGTSYNAATGIVTFTTTSFSDYTVQYAAAAAAIGSQTYGSLANAIAAVKNGETVVLLKDTSGCGIIVPSNSEFTVDFNGHSYTVDQSPLAGSNGTKSQCFQLLKDSKLVFKNGAIRCANSGVAMLIQNYADLTLEKMNIDGATMTRDNTCTYALSNNNGNVLIKNTTITAKSGHVAFDVCRYASYIGPKVTVEGSSVINGKVEISSSGAKEGARHELVITGGTFNGAIVKDGESPDFTASITGGTFSEKPDASYLPEGYGVRSNGSSMWTVSAFKPVHIGDKEYDTIAAAFADVNNQSGEDVVITVSSDLEETLINPCYNIQKNLLITSENGTPVTISLGHDTYNQPGSSEYVLNMVGGHTLTIDENVYFAGTRGFYCGYTPDGTGTAGNKIVFKSGADLSQVLLEHGNSMEILPAVKKLDMHRGSIGMLGDCTLNITGDPNKAVDGRHNTLWCGNLSFGGSGTNTISIKDAQVIIFYNVVTHYNTTCENVITLDNAELNVDGNLYLGEWSGDSRSTLVFKNRSSLSFGPYNEMYGVKETIIDVSWMNGVADQWWVANGGRELPIDKFGTIKLIGTNCENYHYEIRQGNWLFVGPNDPA